MPDTRRPPTTDHRPLPNAQHPTPNTHPRPFFLDFLAAAALVVVAFVGGKGLARTLGAIPALFFFVLVAGLGWYYFRVAWRALRSGREGKR